MQLDDNDGGTNAIMALNWFQSIIFCKYLQKLYVVLSFSLSVLYKTNQSANMPIDGNNLASQGILISASNEIVSI